MSTEHLIFEKSTMHKGVVGHTNEFSLDYRSSKFDFDVAIFDGYDDTQVYPTVFYGLTHAEVVTIAKKMINVVSMTSVTQKHFSEIATLLTELIPLLELEEDA